MKTEWFDVVDSNDQIVDRMPRAEVHRRRELHRAVHIFVFNSKGELFLQQRSMSKDTAPGKWVSSCSGHVDSGEDYDQAARRELMEEIGLAWPSNTRRLFKVPPSAATGYEFVWLYRCEHDGPLSLDPMEIQAGEWFTAEAITAWMLDRPRDFAWSFVHLWHRFLDDFRANH
jgi:isopentenyl-diphosphate delta-isomerase